MKATWILISTIFFLLACSDETSDSKQNTSGAEASKEKISKLATNVAPTKRETQEEKATEQIETEKKQAAENKSAKKPDKTKEVKVPTKKSVKKTPTPSKVQKPTPKPAPRKVSNMQFAATTHNFGKIDQGESIDVTFNFTNTGNGDLQILDAQASCGCTTPSFPFMPIAPGESGKIEVTYNSTGKLGPQRPIVTITTNDTKKIHKLYLDGFVMAELAKEKNDTTTSNTPQK